MKITIWSDIRCPFCYIAKRRLENAISKFEHKKEVIIEWKSYQLDPKLKTNPNIQTIDYYIKKGGNKQQINDLFQYATDMAKEEGIEFKLDDIIVANSFNGHKLIHIAKRNNKQNEAKELLLKAYFADGKNIDDTKTLIEIGVKLGFNAEELKSDLQHEAYANKVQEDQKTANDLGVRGVPFFVFNDRHALSGAQPESTFLEILKDTYSC